ncbi:prolyl oligopeptidase family serine peptidase [bacterium]|nr:prolyl oligopeptidase family serine peptidase [bacterium]
MQAITTQNVTIRLPIDNEELYGNLAIPENAKGLVLFAHGSGSSRHSPRNQFVAEELQNNNFATFLLDLLTEREEAIDNLTRHLRFNIPFLSRRLIAAAAWIKTVSEVYKLNIGLFGASTGGAAALLAAAQRPDLFHAIVSRGGRPDLASETLPVVKAPTLLIVGELDTQVFQLNQYALRFLTSEKKLEIVPGATHLFEEPGKLEIVASIARNWFDKYLLSKPQ